MKKNHSENYSGWLTKMQVAQLLDRSQKAVERMGVAKKIQRVLVRREQDGAQIALYNPKDVERIQRQLHPDAPAFVVPKDSPLLPVLGRSNGTSLAPEVSQAMVRLGDAMMTIAENLKPQQLLEGTSPTLRDAVPVTDRIYLTLPEASALSGLPQVDLRKLVDAQQLAVFRTGRGGIRIKREALEKL